MEALSDNLARIQLSSSIEDYLSKLDEIYELTLEINKIASDAFFQLARANHLNQAGRIKRFGPDFYDNRDRKAVLTIESEGLKDQLQFDEERIKSELRQNVKKEPSSLRNRSQEEKSREKNEMNDQIEKQIAQLKKEVRLLNPIRMFSGGMVPKELSQAQSSFNRLVLLEYKLSKAQKELAMLAPEARKASQVPYEDHLEPTN